MACTYKVGDITYSEKDFKSLLASKIEAGEGVDKLISKFNEDATKEGKIQQSNLAEHQNGIEVGETQETGNRNSIVESGKVKEEKVKKLTIAQKANKVGVETLDDAIAETVGKIKGTSWNNKADKNLTNRSIGLNWLRKDGRTIDQYAHEIHNGYNGMFEGIDEKTIEQAIVDFVIKNQAGASKHIQARYEEKFGTPGEDVGYVNAEDLTKSEQQIIEKNAKVERFIEDLYNNLDDEHQGILADMMDKVRREDGTINYQAILDGVVDEKGLAKIEKFVNESINDSVKNIYNEQYKGNEPENAVSEVGGEGGKKTVETEQPKAGFKNVREKVTPSGIKESTTPTLTPERVSFKEKFAARKEKIAELNARLKKLGISDDANKIRAEIMAEYTDIAIDAIKEGVTSAAEFAKHIGEELSDIIKEAWDKAVENTGNKNSSVKNASVEQKREELGLGEGRAKTTRSVDDVKKLADEAIAKGYNVKETIDDILNNGHAASDVEIELIGRYIAGKEAELRATNSEIERIGKEGGDITKLSEQRENQIQELNDAHDAATGTGSETARALNYRKQIRLEDESLANQFIEESSAYGVTKLTPEQIDRVIKEQDEIQKAQKAYEDKIKELEEENKKLQAQKNIDKDKNTASVRRKHEEYVAERKTIVNDIREKLKKARMEANVVPVPYAKELIAISPDVMKLVKNLVADGVTQLPEVVDAVFDTFKDIAGDITKKDIQDIIAGEYSGKKTKSQINRDLYDLKKEAKAQNKLSDAFEKKQKAETEQAKIKANQDIEAAQKRVRGGRNISDAERLETLKERTKEQIKQLEKELETGEYMNDAPKRVLKLDKEALRLKDEVIKLKAERRTRRAKAEFERRSNRQKALDRVTEVANVPRALMTSFDYSAPLRQGIVATVSHPILASKAAVEMFKQSLSEKRFQRWLEDVRNSDIYPLVEQTKLHIADPHNPKLSLKEEQFMTNLAEKIPIIGKAVRGSERGYIAYLNHLRLNLFMDGVSLLERKGMTYENAPEKYNALAGLINNMTGRGKLGGLEGSAQALNTGLFSPRLIASRLTMLNPVYYMKLPKEVRVMAIKDMAKFVAFGASIMALAKLNGAQTEDDPRSTDFGKIRYGDTRWDVMGGFSQYIRVLSQFLTAQSKDTDTGEIKSLQGYGHTPFDPIINFSRGKLAPVPSFFVDMGYRKDLEGHPVTFNEPETIEKAVINRFIPMLYNDVHTAMQDQGTKALITVGLPSIFGVGVQTYNKDKGKPSNGSLPSLPTMKKMPSLPKK